MLIAITTNDEKKANEIFHSSRRTFSDVIVDTGYFIWHISLCVVEGHVHKCSDSFFSLPDLAMSQ